MFAERIPADTGQPGSALFRVGGDCLAPRIPSGALVRVDGTRQGMKALPGDTVMARIGDRLVIKILSEIAGSLWLVAYQHWVPCPVRPHEIVGVVDMVMFTP